MKKYLLLALLACQPALAADALQEAEGRLNAAYQAALAGLKGQARADLEQAQRNWEAEKAAALARKRYELLEARLKELESLPAPPLPSTSTGSSITPVPELVEGTASLPSTGSGSEERWQVQVGSFKNPEQAEAMRQRLSKKQFDSSVAQNGEWYAVRLSPAQADKAGAEKQRQAFEKAFKSKAMLVKSGGAEALPSAGLQGSGTPVPEPVEGTEPPPSADAGNSTPLPSTGLQGRGTLPPSPGLQEDGAKPGSKLKPGPALLGLLYTEAGQPTLYPLTLREGGKYRAPKLKGKEVFNIFDRGQRVGEFRLQATVNQADCMDKKLGQGVSDLNSADLPQADEAGQTPAQGALLALDSAAPANATQNRAAPLPIEHLALDNGQEAALLKALENRFKLHLKDLPEAYPKFAQPMAINLHEINVYDLDGDGKAEYFAVASAPLAGKIADLPPARASLFAWVGLDQGLAAPLFDLFMPPQADGPDTVAYHLVDVIDLDGDAVPETVLQTGLGQSRQFQIYEYRQGRFEPVFSALACAQR